MPHSPHKPPVYASSYASDVVNNFVMKYARATNFFARIQQVTGPEYVRFLIRLFMYHNPRWNCIRDMIKWFHVTNQYKRVKGMTRDNVIHYLTCVKTQVEDYGLFEKKDFSRVDTPYD